MSDIVHFGRFEIRFDERQLYADGQPVALGSRAFDLLTALVERRERLVGKSELLEVVWPGLIVEENNLQVQVSALRKVLGPQLISTVPGRGYRFTATLEAKHAGAQEIEPDGRHAGTPFGAAASAVTDGAATSGATGGATPGARRGGARAHLLIADDNKVNRLLLGRTLALQGHHIASVDNGREALDALRRERFDLLLLDLEMPEMDGFAVLEQLAVDPALRDLPVIVTSSVEGVPQIARCIELGADDFLHKPVNPVLLKARVGASLEKKRLRDQQKALIERYATGESLRDEDVVAVNLPGQRLPATVLATRLRDFDAFAAAQPPDETIEVLNIWYTLMFDAVGSRGGAVNRMSGDGLMAVFGAPMPPADPADAPLAAVRAALDMSEMLEILNAERAGEDKPPLAIGVGIASGDVVAGTTGAPQRPAYTCVGDAVNAAAALEAQAMRSPHTILIDATTRDAVASRVATDPLPPEKGGRKGAPGLHFVRTS
jgi:DNA-binding response OmpR family regulator